MADHARLELLQVAPPVRRQLDADEHHHGQAELAAVEQRHLALDQPLLLQAMDAPPARRLRQLDLLGDLRRRQVGVVLQQAENPPVEGAQRGLHDFFSFGFFMEKVMRIMASRPEK
ncbi:hypothetical protein D9M71_720990 [compost metagenome]